MHENKPLCVRARGLAPHAPPQAKTPGQNLRRRGPHGPPARAGPSPLAPCPLPVASGGASARRRRGLCVARGARLLMERSPLSSSTRSSTSLVRLGARFGRPRRWGLAPALRGGGGGGEGGKEPSVGARLNRRARARRPRQQAHGACHAAPRAAPLIGCRRDAQKRAARRGRAPLQLREGQGARVEAPLAHDGRHIAVRPVQVARRGPPGRRHGARGWVAAARAARCLGGARARGSGMRRAKEVGRAQARRGGRRDV
jgi:hypothetical protein